MFNVFFNDSYYKNRCKEIDKNTSFQANHVIFGFLCGSFIRQCILNNRIHTLACIYYLYIIGVYLNQNLKTATPTQRENGIKRTIHTSAYCFNYILNNYPDNYLNLVRTNPPTRVLAFITPHWNSPQLTPNILFFPPLLFR